MKIQYLGHACFLLTTSDGTRIVTDPYEPGGGINYDRIGVSAEGVTVSHDHFDHACVKEVGGDPKVINYPTRDKIGSVKIRGVETAHDTSGGAERGANIAFIVEADGITVVHLGDLGHSPSVEQAEEIGPVDVLMMPVGGTYTIDAATAAAVAEVLGAKITIPMHYRTAKLRLDIDPVSKFTKIEAGRVKELGVSECEVTKDRLPATPEVWVLKPAR